jgi:squalene-hopene/tetraprenyl-beta-curcumene cyclase
VREITTRNEHAILDPRLEPVLASNPFAVTHSRPAVGTGGAVSADLSFTTSEAAARAREWLLERQQPDGHWVGELEGDTILETEYVLLLQFLGNPDRRKLRRLCNYVVRNWQNQDGGFPIFPGGPSDVSASVKAYFACKLAAHTPDEPFMQRMRDCILRLGGVTKCNTFTKLYLSIFGQYDWDGVPTIPPEVSLAPNWFFFNIYEMSSWSRAILVPLAIINHARPHRSIPPGAEIDELFVGGRNGKHLRLPWGDRPISWKNAFLVADRGLKVYDRVKVKPLRRKAIKDAEKWMLERQRDSGGLGAIFPAMTHAVMAYKCLGHADDSPAVQHELRELEKFEIEDGDELRLQPCLSPVWDTALSINALIDSGLPGSHPAVRCAADWLISKQTSTKADWAVKTPNIEPGGWFFEYENEFYPDVDDTVMVLMALYKTYCSDGQPWTYAPSHARDSMRRGLDWVLAMQNKDGGWASFDKDNDRMIFQSIPFADHNAMLDPSTADITARTLEMLSFFGFTNTDPRVQRALAYLYREQESDGSWFGRWGVNYIYGTWQVLRGLARIGEPMRSLAVRRAVNWLKSVQNSDGGWGETCRSYEDPENHKAVGPSTASQTSWALIGLINAGEEDCSEVRRGLKYLFETQEQDGTWEEPWFTGTGFPKVFYLRYHLYCHYFPLWAMGQYLSATGRRPRYADEGELVD